MSLLWKLSSTSSRTPAITKRRIAPSQIQTVTLSAPVKYAPLIRQNCLPHPVKRAIRTRMTSVAIAAIAQPLAIQTRDAHSSFPQSIEGVNISIPATYPDTLRTALQTPQLMAVSGSSRQSPPPTNSS